MVSYAARSRGTVPSLVLLVWMGAAGCPKDKDQDEETLDASPDLSTRTDTAKPDAMPDAQADSVTDVSTQPDGSAVDDTQAPLDAGVAPDTRVVCTMPNYSTNCIEVEYFQCGFTAACKDGVLTVSWHEHACDGSSWVSYYNCSYTCPNGCKSDGVPWVSPGKELVAQTCNP
jgi:hypothetical protein